MLHRISKDNVFKINIENFIKIITVLIKVTFNERKQIPNGRNSLAYILYIVTYLLSTYKSVLIKV